MLNWTVFLSPEVHHLLAVEVTETPSQEPGEHVLFADLDI